MASALELAPHVGVTSACQTVGVGRASFYRQPRPHPSAPEWGEPRAPHALGPRDQDSSGALVELPGVDRAMVGPAAAPGPPARLAPRALSRAERQAVLDLLHSPRFRDTAPAAVYATLLDEGVYLASERTMYRLLAAAGESRERRDQLVHPTYSKPELLATEPNQVWSWDITKLLGPVKWSYYYL
jgi:putative transposase